MADISSHSNTSKSKLLCSSEDDLAEVFPADVAVNFNDVVIETEIARGAYGSIYKGTYKGTTVAIKKIDASADPEMKKYIRREISALRSLKHPNIVEFIGACWPDPGSYVYIITEYVPGGDLRALLDSNDVKLTSWKRVISMARDIAQAMFYLHANKVMHRDLKSKNLLVCPNYHLKLCDMGFARRIKQQQGLYMTLVGSETYMSPEILVGEEYNEKTDVFSYGVVLGELITKKRPRRREPSDVFGLREKEFKEEVPKDCPWGLLELMLDCCEYEPQDRPSFEAIVTRLSQLEALLFNRKPARSQQPAAAAGR